MKKPLLKYTLAALTALQFSSFAAPAIHQQEIFASDTKADIVRKTANTLPTKNQMAYHKLEFTAFIHFGINTFTGREWGNGKENAKMFNPLGEVDTDQWCKIFKDAGMTMIMITVKHHDGFCLWQTRYNDKFSVKASPWENGKGDVLRRLADSAKKFDLKLGVYISPADLYQIEHKEGLYGNLSKYQDSIIPTDPASFKTEPMKARKTDSELPTFKVKVDDYNRYMMNQIYETLTEYGPIHEVWFDGAHPKRKGGQTYVQEEWMKMIRALQPEAVIFGGGDVRWCGNEHGGTRADEWSVIHTDKSGTKGFSYRAQDIASEARLPSSGQEAIKQNRQYLTYTISEVDVSLRSGWFWRNDTEQGVKSSDWAFDTYERSVGGNSVFLLNIPPNDHGKISPRDVKVLKETGQRIRSTYGKDLLNTSQVSVTKLRDTNIETYWQTTQEDKSFTIKLAKTQKINRFALQEAISKVGQRISEHAIDAMIDGQWQEIAKAGVIGYKRIHRFTAVETDQLRVRVLKSREEGAIAEIAAYFYDAPPAPVTIKRNAKGFVELVAQTAGHQTHVVKDAKIHYTLDGTTPTKSSSIYDKALHLPKGGTVKALVIKGDQKGSITTSVLGLDPKGWTASSSSEHSQDNSAQNAIDGNPKTIWHTSWNNPTPKPPHTLTIDCKKSTTIGGFMYLPRQDRTANGMVEAWKIEVSLDAKTWQTVAEGEFGNLINDPSARPFYFKESHEMRYFRFTALRAARNQAWASAAEIQLLPKK